jgi:hypothetical protein
MGSKDPHQAKRAPQGHGTSAIMSGIVLSSSDGTGCHRLKVECEHAAGLAGEDESSLEERCALRRTIVVHVRDWDVCEAELVKRSLATC